MLSFTTDRTGFPMVVVNTLQLDVHLFPVTKQQFEMFLAEPNQFEDSWYETILAMNPRGSRVGDGQLEQLFLTGILPSEAKRFAAWLGKDYRLPTVVEWTTVYAQFMRVNRPAMGWSTVFDDVRPASMRCIDALLHREDASLLTKLSRMDEGVMEWIRGRRGWQLAGQPRPGFGHQLFSCRTPVTPTNVQKRSRLCGFRLVRDRLGQ